MNRADGNGPSDAEALKAARHSSGTLAQRVSCCDRWPKPCSYHEGWADADDWWRSHLCGEEGIDWELRL